MLPKVLYNLMIDRLDKHTIDHIGKLFRGFIWASPRGKIRKELISLPIKEGGLGILDLTTLNQCALLLYMKRLLRNWDLITSPQLDLAKFFISNLGADWGLNGSIFTSNSPPLKSTICPKFYLEMVCLSQRYILPYPPEEITKEWALSQPLFMNPFYSNPLALRTQKRLALAGIIRLSDLFDNPEWLTPEGVYKHHSHHISPQELGDLINAVPQVWKDKILDPTYFHGFYTESDLTYIIEDEVGPVGSEINDPDATLIRLHNFRGRRVNHLLEPEDLVEVHLDNLFFFDRPLTEIRLKDTYHQLAKRIKMNSQDYWNQRCLGLRWKCLLSRVWQAHCPPNQNQTYFLLLHKAHFTATRADKQKITLRKNCPCQGQETEEHIFWECAFAQEAWRNTWDVLKKEGIRTPPFKLLSILQPPPNKSFTAAHRLTLHTLWVQRCARTYENPPPSHPHQFLLSLPQALLAALRAAAA